VLAVRRALVLTLAPLLATLALTAGEGRPEAPAASAEPVDFGGQVRPLLAERCFRCHGLDEQKGEVRLDQREAVFRDRDGWSVVVPGDADASELWYRVNADDPEERMPPADAGPPLTPEERDLLRRWIEEGADWREHWALEPVRAAAPPAVADAAWPLQDLDRFLLAEMEERGLEPAPEADRAAWLRRATFVLTGLPPSPQEVENFLADSAPDAHERAADRLLASPHYGEKWARHWLDLVRYAETRGHEFDFRIPGAFEFRDWVVRAYAEDLPYDRFVAEQIAGDLLEPPRLSAAGWNESVLGTGFWWLGEEVHSPVDLRQDQADRTANKVDVFGKTFLGLTVACARCHDHKFDPILAQDFYALAGVAQSISYREVRFESLESDRALRAALEALRADGEEALRAEFRARAAAGLRSAPDYRARAQALKSALAAAGAAESFAGFEEAEWSGWTAEGEAFAAGPLRRGDRPEYFQDFDLDGEGGASSHDPRGGRDVAAADALRGSLVSAEFTIGRDEIRLLVAGGNHPGKACVNLEVDGATVFSETGRDARAFTERAWDVRPWRGRRARIRILDDQEGSWAWIAADRIEFRDSAAGLSEREAARWGLDPERLLAWARDGEEPPPAARVALAAEHRVIEDWGREDFSPLLQDGSAWVRRATGAAHFGSDPARALLRVFDLGCASADPLWSGLRAAPGAPGPDTSVRWAPSGRTLRSRAFRLGGKPLWYLAQGRGTAFASVASHRTLTGPLHGGLALGVDAPGGWTWIRHDLSEYAGMNAHLEFTPREGGGEHPDEPPFLSVAMIVEADAPPALERADSWEGAELAWAAAHPSLLGPLPPAADPVERFLARQQDLLAARILVSRVAPAVLEGGGLDEPRYARGDPAQPAEDAPRRNLSALRAAMGDGGEGPGAGESGRLALAAATASVRNPLTARVYVNRVWHHAFGRGIAPATDNFGALGQQPSHPELLDWLAERFVSAHGWRLKPLLREIVLSRAFRMASAPRAASAARDPANRWLHAFPVRRLEAEDLRDALLAVSGRLDRRVGGPSVPVHLTSFMEGRGRPGSSGPLDGDGRRSLYLEVRRNFLNPFLQAFDFPTPFTTIGNRTVSNVPAQALALMNDPFVDEMAESWTERLLATPLDEDARIRRAYLEAFGRPPAPEETEIGRGFLAGPGGNWRDYLHALLLTQEFQYVR